MDALINRNELRRLEKAARDKNKEHLKSWAKQYDDRVCEIYRKHFEKVFKEELQDSIDNIMLAVAYTLHFSESIKLGKKRLPEFMDDLFVTIDMFRTGEYTPSDYREGLESCGIFLDYTYDYSRVYKEGLKRLEEVIEQYNNRVRELEKRLDELNETK